MVSLSINVKKTITRFFVFSALFVFVYALGDVIAASKSAVFAEVGNDRQIVDFPLNLFAPLNVFLNNHLSIATWFIGYIELVIDFSAALILLASIFGPSLRPALGLFCVECLRMFMLVLVIEPNIPGCLYFNIGLPTFASYAGNNDFFFSGHTALTVYAALLLKRIFPNARWVFPVQLGAVGLMLFCMFALHYHYTADVYAGAVTALWVSSWIHTVQWPERMHGFLVQWNLEDNSSSKVLQENHSL